MEKPPAAQKTHLTGLSGDAPLPVAVIGCGRMGKFHARTFMAMPDARLVGVYDADAQQAADVAGEFECLPFTHLDEAAEHVAAVSIAVPTQFHAAVAKPFLKKGIACLIEKPMARDSDEAREIVRLSRQHGAIVQIGHIERFNPAFRAMQRLNVQAGFMEVSRVSPMTFRSIDVGAVLDLMIHDIDIVLKLANSPLARCEAIGVSVIGGVEDICNARLTFENGCVANLTASRLALKSERKLRVFSRDAYVSLDYQARSGIVIRRGGNLEAIRAAVARIRSGEIKDLSQLNYKDLVNIEQLPIDQADPLRAQLESFVTAVRTGSPPAVTAEEGLAAIIVAERILQAVGKATL